MDTEAFIRWALDQAREVEERYAVELLVESAMGSWHSRHKTGYYEPHEERRERQRTLNPAYDPRYSEENLRRAAEILAEQTSWRPYWGYEERPIRDLGALRFLPALEALHLGRVGVADLSPLAELPRLRSLDFSSTACEDFRPLARCRGLRTLSLSLGTAGAHWPEVAGLETLEELETLTLSGNLTLTGPVRDFAPLIALRELTWLSYHGGSPLDVTPLARLPRLRFITFESKHNYGLDTAKPRDYSPLAAAPALREVQVTGCPPVEMEVAALNAGLPPWDPLFLAETPRPVPPRPRMIVAPMERHPRRPTPHRALGEPELVDDGLRACEGRWVAAFVTRTITEALGHADWGRAGTNADSRHFSVHIESYGVVEKLPEILDAARGVMARLRDDWEAGFTIFLKSPRIEATPAQIELQKQFQDVQEKADRERRWREREEYLERQHLSELQKQEGEPVDPAEFAAPAPLPLPEPPWRTEDDEDGDGDETEDEDEDEGDESGGVKVKRKPDPPPSWFDDDEHPLADNYRLMGHLSLTEAWFLSHNRDVAVYLMRRKPDEEIPEDDA